MWKTVLGALVFAFLVGMLFVRFVPLNAEALHVDPQTAPVPDVPGHALIRGEDAPRYEMARDDLAAKLDAIIAATPRTRKLAGDLSTGHATYVTRSRLWGFPDVANVAVVENADGTVSPVILSRLRYGYDDMGVNAARVQDWLDQL